jgi:hypothetical protein
MLLSGFLQLSAETPEVGLVDLDVGEGTRCHERFPTC